MTTNGGPDDGAARLDGWRVLDILVSVAIGVIVVLAAEWLVGYVVRQRIAAGAQRHLAKVNSQAGTDGPAE